MCVRVQNEEDAQEKKRETEAKKDYHTQASQVVPHLSTIYALRGLTSVIGRELVLLSRYGGSRELRRCFLLHEPLKKSICTRFLGPAPSLHAPRSL